MFFPKVSPKKLILSALAMIFLLVFVVVVSGLIPQGKTKSDCFAIASSATTSAKTLPIITKAKLKDFDGIKSQKIYIALDCLVYDVTAGKSQYYGEGKSYHYLVGRDATAQLKIFGGDIIKQKYPIVGILGN